MNLGEQAFLGGNEDSRAIHVNASAFEYEAMRADHGAAFGHVVQLGDLLGDLIVAAPVVVFGPGVEAPVGDGDLAGRILCEDGAGVAEPDTVGGPLVKVETGHVGAAALEDGFGTALGGLVVDEDVDLFDAGEVADDLGVDPGDGLEFAGPVLRVMGPGYPRGVVWFPLGGHAKCGRRFGLIFSHLCLSVSGEAPP